MINDVQLNHEVEKLVASVSVLKMYSKNYRIQHHKIVQGVADCITGHIKEIQEVLSNEA